MLTLKLVKTSDGSYTFFSPEYDECFHSVKGGAILESFFKFSLPLFKDLKEKKKKEIFVLDIGFGLGYNILSLIYLHTKFFKDIKLNIISIEKNKDLINLVTWNNLPKKLSCFSYILDTLKNTYSKCFYLSFESGVYFSENLDIILLFEDIRKILPKLKKAFYSFDYIFHDAFSFLKNPEAWSYEIFLYEKALLKNEGKIFTYACAKPIKRVLLELSFSLKLNTPKDKFLANMLKDIIYDISFQFSLPQSKSKDPIKAILEIFERHPGLEATKTGLSLEDKKLLEALRQDKKSIFYRDNIFLNKDPKKIKLERENAIKSNKNSK